MSYFETNASPTLQSLLRLDGRVALVAGGAGYLGTQASDVLTELGASVVIASRNLEECRTRANQIAGRHPTEPEPSALKIDVSSTSSTEDAVRELINHHGRLDIVANFSWSGKKNSLDSITLKDWQYDIDVSLNGAFRLAKAALPHLKSTAGTLLNVGSMYGLVAPDEAMYPSTDFANPPSYGAAKAGVLQLTRYLAAAAAKDGIRVNSLSPGPFPFPSTLAQSPEFALRLESKNPMKRVGKPHEIRGAVAFLCSDASSFVTGENLCVDGGWTAW